MSAERGGLWTTLAAMLAGALIVAAVVVTALGRYGVPAGAYVVLFPALLYATPLVLALVAGREPGPARPPADDLDHLLTLKRTGHLPPACRPPRRGTPLLAPGAAPRVPPAVDEPAVLDRLVERRREWAGPGEPYPNG